MVFAVKFIAFSFSPWATYLFFFHLSPGLVKSSLLLSSSFPIKLIFSNICENIEEPSGNQARWNGLDLRCFEKVSLHEYIIKSLTHILLYFQVESPTDKTGSFFCLNHWEGENLNAQLFTHTSAVEDVPVHIRVQTVEPSSCFILTCSQIQEKECLNILRREHLFHYACGILCLCTLDSRKRYCKGKDPY